ncbi:MAG: globin [Planctomycetes bacterium]|nr:globin [Planctomycetota bacterium]
MGFAAAATAAAPDGTCLRAPIHHAGGVSAAEELPIFDLLGGETIARIVAGFYRRVPEDPILGPMYPPDDLAGAEQRLRSFLIYRFGGPPDYLRDRGHPRLRQRHAPFAIDRAARDRWLALMLASVDEQGVAPAHRDYLARFLGDIATFLQNRP